MILNNLVLLLLICVRFNVEGVNILGVSATISPSHYLFMSSLLLPLADQGYNVTLLTHDTDRFEHPNYTHVYMEGAYEFVYKEVSILDFIDISAKNSIDAFFEFANLICKYEFSTKGLKQLMDYPPDFKFDLIIIDYMTNQCLYPLINRFKNPPVIGLRPFISQPYGYENVWQSYMPFYLRRYTDHMTLWERIENTYWMAYTSLMREYVYFPEQNKIAKQYFGENIPTLEEIERNISLFMVNHNNVLNYPLAFPPNIIPVGGLQIANKPLPKNIKDILDEAENGVIILSFGTNIKSSLLGSENLNSLLNAFGKLNETVIWKFEENTLENVPKNVIIRKWLPQSDMLGHPNVKLAILHAGLLSSQEAVYYGLPLVLTAFAFDQINNVHNLVNKGIAMELRFDDLKNSDIVYSTIVKALNDEKLATNAKKLSLLYRDQPQKTLDLAIYWVKYMIKHGSAKHFDLATRDMNLIQYLNLDLVLLVLVTISFLLFCLIYLPCRIFGRILRKTRTNCDQARNKKNK